MPSIFRTRKPKQFNYHPLVYDERKENLRQREERINRDMNSNTTVRTNFREEWKKRNGSKVYSSSNFRILMIAGLLALAAYLYLKF